MFDQSLKATLTKPYCVIEMLCDSFTAMYSFVLFQYASYICHLSILRSIQNRLILLGVIVIEIVVLAILIWWKFFS